MGIVMPFRMNKVSEKTNLELALHMLTYFLGGWLVISIVYRFTQDVNWPLAFIGGFIFSGILILVSLISILHKRKNHKK